MAYSDAYQAKLKLFKDAIQMEKGERIPNLSNVFTWKILDSDLGYTLTQAMSDYAIMEKVVCEFHERYQFDGYMDLGTRNNPNVTACFGKNHYTIDDVTGAINFTDKVLMEGTEYKEFREDPMAFHYKMMQRKYPGATKGQAMRAVYAMAEFGNFSMNIAKKFAEELSVPSVMNMSGIPQVPFESFFSYYRGIKGVSIDMRKHGDEMKETFDALFEKETIPLIQNVLRQDSSAYVCDFYSAMIAHSTMNVKQFEKFYWPYLKKILDLVVENNKTIYLFAESNMLRFAEYFQDIPKGHVVLHLELDDIFEVRKQLPNLCLAGGMPTHLLGTGTPEQCVDYAKKLVDTLGEGFIFSQDKMVSFRNDCKRENLLAVNDFIRNYRV